MNKFFKLFIVILCLSQIYCRGFNFGEATTTATFPPIKDFSTADENEAWLVTEKGSLFHLFNDGRTNQEVKFETRIRQVYFLNVNEGWIIEENGQIWITTNDGKDWSKRGIYTQDKPYHIVFADNQVGWIIGAFNIWLTEDSGNAWAMVYPNEQVSYDKLEAQPLSLFAVNSDIAWVGLTNSKVLRTVNRGKSWEEVSIPGKYDIHGLYPFSANECIVAARNGGGLYQTTDGGKNWQQVVDTKANENLGIDSVSFVNKKIGWAAGQDFVTNVNNPETNRKVLLKTMDGGKNWARIELGFEQQQLTRVNFSNEKKGWIVGDKNVYTTTDAGRTWKEIFKIEDDKQLNK
jgi:photosystem II stability/assembly factor-like uncharacterized protein